MLPEVGFTELLVIAAVMLLVLKPADLPIATAKRNLQGMYEGWLEQADEQPTKRRK
jgi:Sec-independent protein translocase protein TatA